MGAPLPLLTFRLEAVPEMGYDPLANPPRGEIIIKGPVVFQGYYQVTACHPIVTCAVASFCWQLLGLMSLSVKTYVTSRMGCLDNRGTKDLRCVTADSRQPSCTCAVCHKH